MSASLAPFERPATGLPNTTVFKSGPLYISSKGIGWKSWKKRWFILSRTSLVFFKSDPSLLPQRDGEVNLTLGGIDLNNSGSVVVREDKKLLTVLFPDDRDGRAFTLKAESSEDLYEWKTALEQVLAQAPSATLVLGNNGMFRNDTNNMIENSFHQWRDKYLVKSLVVGRPILLALEDIDGSPSFLEKALCFLEKFGTKVEGILRQSADVDEVDRRVQEYDQGKTEFNFDEDPHVVGDCIKRVLRELPSSPVPASCCTALLEAYRVELKEARVNALRSAILETFPEPNQRLFQRILKMMHTIAAHATENRMTPSAVAACMAPLLLRPLLAGECNMEEDCDERGDSSAQLLAAANAANNAQAVITTVLEEYKNIFTDDILHRFSFSANSRTGKTGNEDSSDDDNLDTNDIGYHDAENEVDEDLDRDPERVLSGKLSESSGYAGSDLYDYKVFQGDDSDAESSGENENSAIKQNLIELHKLSIDSNVRSNEQNMFVKGRETSIPVMTAPSVLAETVSCQSTGESLLSVDTGNPLPDLGPELCAENPSSKLSGSNVKVKCSTSCRRNTAQKDLSMESLGSSSEEAFAIQRLEIAKDDLQNRIAKEAKGNAILQASLERRKQALLERRMGLEQDVSRLQEQLQAERDLRAALEVGLSMSSGQFPSSCGMDSKTRAELEEIALAEADVARLKQKVAELHLQLNQQRQHHYGSLSESCDRYQYAHNLHSQQKFLRQDFDATLAYCYRERKQRSKEGSSLADWRNIKGQVLPSSSSGRQLSRKQFSNATSFSDSTSTEASKNISVDDLCDVDSATVPSTSMTTEVYQRQPSTSSALVELTTRLDFFKERHSQLIEQLHNLDLDYGVTSSQGMTPSSPWN